MAWDAHTSFPSLASKCRCEKTQTLASCSWAEQSWIAGRTTKKSNRWKYDNLSSVYVVLCLTLPLSMEDTYKCGSLGHQRKDINGFDRISQTDGLWILHIALCAGFELLPTFHVFLTSSKVSLEISLFQKVHMEVHTGLQVGLKHVFVPFLKKAPKWHLPSDFQTRVTLWNCLLKLHKYEEY